MKQPPLILSYAAGVILLIVAVRIGLKLPDIDQKVSFLSHRSLLTHGMWLPLLLFFARRDRRATRHAWLDPMLRLFIIGLSLSLAVHLCFDLFPRAWRGFALIKAPFYGSTGASFSQLWIGASCILGVYLALLLIKHVWELMVGGVALPLAFTQHVSEHPHEQNLAALLALLVATALALALPSNAARWLRQWKPRTT